MFTNGDRGPSAPTDGDPAAAASGDEPAAPESPEVPDALEAPPEAPMLSEENETASAVAALAEAAAELDEVEAALRRLEDGSFDTCEICGQPIGRERLLENPLLTRCARHTGAA